MASKGKYVRVTLAHQNGKFPPDVSGYLVVGYIRTGSGNVMGRDLLLERQYSAEAKAPRAKRKPNAKPATDTAAVVANG